MFLEIKGHNSYKEKFDDLAVMNFLVDLSRMSNLVKRKVLHVKSECVPMSSYIIEKHTKYNSMLVCT